MRETCDIFVDPRSVPTPEVMEQLLSLYPEGKWTTCFRIQRQVDDPITQNVLHYLASVGMRPRLPYSRNSYYELKFFQFNVIRHYDVEDYEAARYLQPVPKATLGLSVIRSSEHRLILMPRQANQKNLLAAANWAWLVVSDDMRRQMEAVDLRQLKFNDVEFTTPPTAGSLMWELTSNLRLPRMSSRCKFVEELGGMAVQGGWQPGAVLVEGDEHSGEISPEFHYTESAIRAVEPFDLALTLEGWGGGEGIPKLVASQRFYQFCKSHKLKMDWIPVRIDPD